MTKHTPTVLVLDDEATKYGEDFADLVNMDILNYADDPIHRDDGHLFFATICDVTSFTEATDLVAKWMPDIVLIDNYYCNEALGAKIGQWIHKKYPWMVRIGNSSSLLKENMDYSELKFSDETVSLLRHLRDLPEGMGKFRDPFIFTVKGKTLHSMSNDRLVGMLKQSKRDYNTSPDPAWLDCRDTAICFEINRRIRTLKQSLINPPVSIVV